MDLYDLMTQYLLGIFKDALWISVAVELAIIIFIASLLHIALSKFFKHAHRIAKRSKTHIDDIIFNSAQRPALLVLWGFTLTLCLQTINLIAKVEQMKRFNTALFILAMFALGWFLLNAIEAYDKIWQKRIKNEESKLDLTTQGAIIKLLKISTIIIVCLVTLDSLGVSISAIVAFGSASGFGISFAAKDMVSNYFGALMIYLDKPFKVGDWIRVPEQNIEGVVDKIGLRCTVLRTLEKRPLYVPNSVFANTSIENPSRMSHRRIKETIILKHEDLHNIEHIVKDINQALIANPNIDKDYDLVVKLSALTNNGIEIMLYCFTTKTEMPEFYDVKQEIMFSVAKVIEKYEAALASFPQALMHS